MSVLFKCKMCGGDLNVQEGCLVCECDYCGTQQTVPALDNEKKVNLFNRANRLRMNSEFDKAGSIYEQIIAEFPEEAEAYWGLCLCNYGIEYVDDPATAKKIPTVHRASFEKLRKDENYELAIENADMSARIVYQQEAKEIDRIMGEILSISQTEEPYDIFICYKETDNYGERTQDSVIAQDIYDALTNKGYKVFFSRITLEDKLGMQYEPYIFAALNSAKIMLAIGTDYEYYNAVWVKNEWGRFLKLAAKDKTKVLILCFKDMDAYDMPNEFKGLQAQDMSKLGFIQDITRGIDKIFGRDNKPTTQHTVIQQAVSANSAAATTDSLLKRVFIFLEDGNWNEANNYCEKVLDIDPECAEAYLGKLMAELQVKNRKHLADCDEPFDDRDNYSKVLRFGDETLEKEIRGCIKHINERNENTRIICIYNGAVKAMNSTNEEEAYRSAAHTFKSISGFKDAEILAEKCLDKAEQLRQQREAKEDANRLEAKRKAEEHRIAAEKAKKIAAVTIPIVCACIAFIVVLNTVIIPNNKYNSAVALYENGNYNEAILEFKSLDGYKDSEEQIENCYVGKYGEEKWSKIKNIKVGDTFTFGTYEQDNNTSNGKEAIEWMVLAKEGMSLLLISDKALDCQKYNTSFTDVTWENCSLRKWLNSTFLNNAFSTEEQTLIQSTTVSADKNSGYSTNPGNDTTDKVFLLSITEVNKYFSSDEGRKCVPTEYAIAQGAYSSDIYTKGGIATCWWWLRSPGYNQNSAATVYSDGSVNYYGVNVSHDYGCVRPALWINLDS